MKVSWLSLRTNPANCHFQICPLCEQRKILHFWDFLQFFFTGKFWNKSHIIYKVSAISDISFRFFTLPYHGSVTSSIKNTNNFPQPRKSGKLENLIWEVIVHLNTFHLMYICLIAKSELRVFWVKINFSLFKYLLLTLLLFHMIHIKEHYSSVNFFFDKN